MKRSEERGKVLPMMNITADAKKAPAISSDDPVLAALRRAPVGPPMTQEEGRAMEEARELGRWVSGADVHAEVARRCQAGK